MQSSGDLLKNKTIEDIVREAREKAGSNISPELEKSSKDMGHGILVPNAFQIPNEIIDQGWLAQLTGAEIKILIFIIRKNFVFNKIGGDRIPISQIIKGTGLSDQGIIEATKVLEHTGLIKVTRGRTPTGKRLTNYYQLTTRLDYNRSIAK